MPSSRIDHPERTSRRRTLQPTLSKTSAVAGSDRAESPLGSRPPAPCAVDGSTASAAPSHARRQGMRPGIRTASERSGALPARPPQFHGRPSSQYARTAATADGSSRGDDPVDRGTSYLSFPLSAAAEDDDMSYTRRAMDSSTEGGARVHPPIVTHPRGMEGVRRESRTSPAAYWPGDSRFAFKPATAVDDLHAGARGLAVPVARPHYHALTEREARVDTLPAWQRIDVNAPASCIALSTARTRAPSQQIDDALSYTGTATPKSPLYETAGCDQMLRTRRVLYSAIDGGARVHPPITHPRGMEDVQRLSRTSPSAHEHVLRVSPVASEPTSATDAFEAGEYRARRVVTTRPATFATSRAPSEQEGDAPVLLLGMPQGQLHDAAGRDLKSQTHRALYSATEGGARVHPSSTHPRGVEGVAPQSPPPPSVANSPTLGRFYRSFEPGSLDDDNDFRAGPSQHRRSRSSAARSPPLALTAERVSPSSRNASSTAAAPRALRGQEDDPFVIPVSLAQDSRVAVIAESVGSAMRTVYDFGKKYISILPSTVTNVVQDLSRALAEEQRNTRSPFTPPNTNTAPTLLAGRQRRPAPSLSATRMPFSVARSCSVDSIHCDDSLRFAAPHDATVGDDYYCAQSSETRSQYNGLPSSPHTEGSAFPSIAAITPCNDGRSNPWGCDMSYKYQSSMPSAATNNSIKSTSQRTPALEGGAGVLRPKSHLHEMEGASTEDALPEYAETSAPGTEDPRFARGVKTSQDAMNALEKKHLYGARGEGDDKILFADGAVLPVAPVCVQMFSRQSENPDARAVLRGLQSSYDHRDEVAHEQDSASQPRRRQSAGRNVTSRAWRSQDSQRLREADGDGNGPSLDKEHNLSRYQRRARALRNAKLPMPTYDGCADLQVYEAFVFKWDSWIRNRGLGEKDSVELMYNALTGEALEWYLSFVAMDDYAWTSREIYQELYEYCFPSNFREELRLKLMTSRQDGHPVKRFAKDLHNLAQRFSDVGQSTLKRLLWDGVDPYIRVFWVEKGRSAEYDDYNTLVHYAHRAERREAEIRLCLDSEGAEVETELSPRRENNPDRGVTAHAVRMRQVALQSEEQPVPMEYEEPEYSEGEQEYYSEEESEGEREDSQQYNDEYGDGEDEYYYSQDESEGREHESQEDLQGEYYEDEYEEYGEAEHQPDEYGDEEYPYSEGEEEERDGDGEDYYNEDGEDEGEYYDDEGGDEDEEDGHSGEPPLNTRRNEYGEDEYESEGSLYED